jgi:hypothetical protein
MSTQNNGGNKMSEEGFVINAIRKLRTPPYKGIHSVWSGFNRAFREYFDKNPVEATQRLAKEGKIVIRPVKGGVILYLTEDSREIPKSEDVIKKIVGE